MSVPTPPATRLWDKGLPLDELVHRFTVGDDPLCDLLLVHDDCLGSAAHARTLHQAGLLSADELHGLLAGLREIDLAASQQRFQIAPEQEDCHTAIEALLTARCGQAGEKIHTGRSRNDQVATAMRLYLRRQTLHLLDGLAAFAHVLLHRIEQAGDTPMPGYTHMQLAMPSSVGQWLHAHLEAAFEQMHAGLALLERLDACPLGTGAGFGVPLPLDRALTARLLGFSRVQRSPIDVQNSRGRYERCFARLAADLGGILDKLSCDLLIFSSPGFVFFSLPAELTTGSSIMPQKRNPDVLELMRARATRLRARVWELEAVTAKLPSSYHRDLQLTKEPVFRAAADADALLAVAARVVALFEVRTERLAAAMVPELYATLAVYRLVREGMPFRAAYRQVAADIQAGRFTPPPPDPSEPRPELVTPQLLAELRAELAGLRTRTREWSDRIAAAETAVLRDPGRPS
jgi:argininosuccinate lyase